MFAAVTSVAMIGIEPCAVQVEAHVRKGRARLSIVGLPDTAVREAKERVWAAVAVSGFGLADLCYTVNLAPADLPKAGSMYDLPIALGVLAALGKIDVALSNVVAVGELALDGAIRAVPGSMAALVVAREHGMRCLLPPGTTLSLDEGDDAVIVASLTEAIAAAGGVSGRPVPPPVPSTTDTGPDLGDVRGQRKARRAIEIAAAGGHHLFMAGPPGAGKTMLAKCLPGLLPVLEPRSQLEVALAHDASGREPPPPGVRPFRAPHHSATMAALVGGGTGVPQPGEITLAHQGVLFLDELGEFPPQLLDALRQPIEDGEVTVARRGAAVRFPCVAQVVAAANPCPCGYAGDRLVGCDCSDGLKARYRRRFSGPLLDRFDLQVRVDRLPARDLTGPGGEPSPVVARRVWGARERQMARGSLNARLNRNALDRLAWSDTGLAALGDAAADGLLTARGWDRIRRVARTVADLDASHAVGGEHVAEALRLRASE